LSKTLRGGNGVCGSTLLDRTEGVGDGILSGGGVGGLLDCTSRTGGSRVGKCEATSNAFVFAVRPGWPKISEGTESVVEEGPVIDRKGPPDRTGTVDGWTKDGGTETSCLSNGSKNRFGEARGLEGVDIGCIV
jgi:hypothetical protein